LELYAEGKITRTIAANIILIEILGVNGLLFNYFFHQLLDEGFIDNLAHFRKLFEFLIES
jgi:hypothetical protein